MVCAIVILPKYPHMQDRIQFILLTCFLRVPYLCKFLNILVLKMKVYICLNMSVWLQCTHLFIVLGVIFGFVATGLHFVFEKTITREYTCI